REGPHPPHLPARHRDDRRPRRRRRAARRDRAARGRHHRLSRAVAPVTALLTVTDVHAGYLPGVDILQGLSIAARANEITLVIGPNGAGKSTLLRTVFAFLAPNQGSMTFRERTTAGLRPSDLKASGISYVTQDINSFPGLTVEENLRMGAWVFRRDSARLARQLERVYATFPALAGKRHARAGE